MFQIVTWRDPLKSRLLELLRATLSIVFQSLMWLGSWNTAALNSEDVANKLDYYPTALTFYGLTAMLLCRTCVLTVPCLIILPSPRFIRSIRTLCSLRSLQFWPTQVADSLDDLSWLTLFTYLRSLVDLQLCVDVVDCVT
jgi:hypothetical protein